MLQHNSTGQTATESVMLKHNLRLLASQRAEHFPERTGMEGLPQTDGGRPLVSIIVRTCDGRQQLLHECLRSIDAQEYRVIEIVVVEDGSASSQALVERFRAQPIWRCSITPSPRGGRCRAGNKGLESASGCLLNFLDDDDQFFPNHVGVLAEKLRQRPDLAAAYTLSLAVRTSLRSLDPLVYTAYPGHPSRAAHFRWRGWSTVTFCPSNR